MSAETQARLFHGGNAGGGKRRRLSESRPHGASDTSQAAARQTCVVSDRDRVAAAVLRTAHVGMTCDEIEQRLGLTHQTASARVKGLLDEGLLVVDVEQQRHTRSGRKARVYVHAQRF